MTETLRLRLLGPARVEREGQLVPGLQSGKPLALLGYLVAQRPCGEVLHSREHLADLLWQDLPAERGRANLSWTLHKLSSSLPGCLHADRHTVCFQRPAGCWIDACAFDTLVARGAVESLAEAIELYRGVFLQGLSLDGCPDYELWLVSERERWQQRALDVLAELVAHHSRRGEIERALNYARRLLTLAPWREEMHRQVMCLLAESGQRSAALAQYQACRHALDVELGVAPSAETTALYERISAGEVGPSATAPSTSGQEHERRTSAASVRHNLPAQVTPFIGREAQLAEIRQSLLRPGVRLLTLTGPGGTGKTRLALQVAAGMVETYDDGICFVLLAPVRDPAMVAPTIATTLGVRESEGTTLLEALQFALRDRECLLVLDNCEHLLADRTAGNHSVGPAHVVSVLLSAAPRLKVLATSRAPLHVYGEHEVAVPPMEVPYPLELPSVKRLGRSEAVALFVQCARRVRPDFALDEENAPAVAELCARLDGLPLAVELAAARARLFSPQAMLAHLDRAGGLSFPADGPRDLPARQRSLRATIEWSYNLLDADEQALFRRLSVFAGSCTLEAIDAICADPFASSVPHTDVGRPSSLYLLESLTNQSLLQISRDTPTPHFTMLETVREYAAERLEESGEAETSRMRHACHYMALAEASEPAWCGAQEATWFDRLESELDNLRAALAWATGNGAWATEGGSRAPEVALRLAGALGRFWNVRGPIGEGRDWLAAALAMEGAGAPALDRCRARALQWAGWLASFQGDARAAHAPLAESVALWRRLGETRDLGWALGHQAMAFSWHDLARARVLIDRAVVTLGQVDDPALLGRALATKGVLTMLAGNLDQARAMVMEGLALAQESQALDTQALATRLLGGIALAQGDYATARSFQQKSLTLFRAAKVQPGIANRLCDLGDLCILEGDNERARACYCESLELRRKVGLKGAVVSTLVRLAYLALRQNDLAEARAHLAEALGLGREMPQMVEGTGIACLLGEAGLAQAQGQPERAARLLGAVDAAWARGVRPLTAICPHVFERLVHAVRAQLDEAALEAAWVEGRDADLWATVEELLAELAPDEPH